MRIKDLLKPECIELNGTAATKKEAIEKMVDLMVKGGNISDVETYKAGVFAREEEGTTGVGEGVAIPHAKSDAVKAPGLAAMVVKGGMDYQAMDNAPVDLIFLIAAPNTKENVHLDVLASLSMLLMDEAFTAKLRSAKTVEEFLDVIDKAESAKDTEVKEKVVSNVHIVAVTACPTGIAHTYMAAEALEQAARKAGYDIKVETRGSGGAKNVLTADEIAAADGVILACDTKVPTDRFAGKRVIECKAADGINKADELVERIAKGEGKVFSSDVKAKAASAEKSNMDGSIGHQIYTHLMNGVSHMLPFVIGGGIMIALAFLIDTLCGFGATGGGNFGNCTPISSFLKYAGGLAMGLMVPVLAGYIAESIADRPGLAVGFTGGLIAANGNALAANFDWGEVHGLQAFVSNFAFQGPNAGTTVSGFLGGIVVGFLAGYVILGLKKLCANMPESLEGVKPTLIYPLGGVFIVSVLMCFIFNPLIGLINTGLSTMLTAIANAGMITVLGLILGAMMAIDMGGPINKAAYVFGTGMLATASEMMASGMSVDDPAVKACYIAMASIMAGGMVPPVGIALACIFFPKKFTEAERNSKVSNIVMGCSFITEGAIPFAASDPGHVIPCTLVGSGVAGALSAFFGCTLMAPHGGIFVFATVGNPLLYIVAWLVGSAVTCAMLGFIKKDAVEA